MFVLNILILIFLYVLDCIKEKVFFEKKPHNNKFTKMMDNNYSQLKSRKLNFDYLPVVVGILCLRKKVVFADLLRFTLAAPPPLLVADDNATLPLIFAAKPHRKIVVPP